jgi:hypothetical protein
MYTVMHFYICQDIISSMLQTTNILPYQHVCLSNGHSAVHTCSINVLHKLSINCHLEINICILIMIPQYMLGVGKSLYFIASYI